LDKKILWGDKGKLFMKILGLGEWAPLFLVLSRPTPLSISPRGFHVEQALHGRSLIRGMMAGHRHRQGHSAGHRWHPGRPRELPDRPVGLLMADGRSEWANGGPTHFRGFR
jgi:hypothetical protein